MAKTLEGKATNTRLTSYFTDPLTSPSTIYRWTHTASKSVGTIRTIPRAVRFPQWMPYSAPVNSPTATGSVLDAGDDVKIWARRNSFQFVRKVTTSVVTSPGAAVGRKIRYRILISVQPSIRAASRMDCGTASNEVFRNQMARGRVVTT